MSRVWQIARREYLENVRTKAFLIGLIFWLLRAKQKVKPEDRRLLQLIGRESSPIDVVRALRTWSEAAFPHAPSGSLEELGHQLGPRAKSQIARLQEAAFGQSSGPVDAASLAWDIVRRAQECRRQSLVEISSDLLERLFGVSRKLPEIDGSPTERTRYAARRT